VTRIVRHIETGDEKTDPIWEAAYQRFETPEEEIRKFLGRYRWFGAEKLLPETSIVEIFCGRGNGLRALESLGFKSLAGVDLSERLLTQYTGQAELHLADCRELPFNDGSVDLVIVQGGLHHLLDLTPDLSRTLKEVQRVLRSTGRFWIVEPWQTPFLSCVHAMTNLRPVRKLWGKAEALATMTEREKVTYERWLASPTIIQNLLTENFQTERLRIGWGKLYWSGIPIRI
jgi:ubiquinone/menaquinone biosynthesis C-methylase UbiE